MMKQVDTGEPERWVQLLIDLYFSARRKKLHLPWMEFVEDYLRDATDDPFVVRVNGHKRLENAIDPERTSSVEQKGDVHVGSHVGHGESV